MEQLLSLGYAVVEPGSTQLVLKRLKRLANIIVFFSWFDPPLQGLNCAVLLILGKTFLEEFRHTGRPAIGREQQRREEKTIDKERFRA